MEILGIGPFELLLILILALILLGPQDMVKAGRSLGRTLRKIVQSPEWRSFQEASREIRHLPERLMREAGLEDLQDIRKQTGLDEVQSELRNDIEQWKKDVALPSPGTLVAPPSSDMPASDNPPAAPQAEMTPPLPPPQPPEPQPDPPPTPSEKNEQS